MATRPERQSQGDVEDDGEWSDNEADDDGQERAACVLQNSSYCLEIFWIPELISDLPTNDPTIFRQIRLPNQINLRNLNIQPIKYATLSDIVLYAKGGISAGVVRVAEQMVQAQNAVYEERMAAWYADAHFRGVTKQGEGLDRPVRYGVWIIKEPFEEIQRACPQLVQLDSKGRRSTRYGRPYALFEREIYEAAAMTRACEVAPNFWVGNDMDVPGKEGDGAWWHHRFDLCILASEMNDMPTENDYHVCKRTMREIEKDTRQQEEAKLQQEKRQAEEREKGQAEGLSGSGMASPATVALRNILSGPSTATSKTAKKDASQPIRTFDYIDLSSGSGKRGPSDSRDDLASIPASKNPRFAGKAQTQAELDAAVYPYA
jgi:dual specificity MAP kinase phosphatase